MPKKSKPSIARHHGLDPSDLGIDPGFETTFPVKLTAKHLPKLNEVFEDFARCLRHALLVYKEGGNSGRDGAGACLITINLFLLMFEIIDKDNLTTPLHSIIGALASLNQNNQLPILTPVPSTGRAKSSYMRSLLEGWSVVTVERIMGMGVPLDKACETVAKHLVKAGVKSTRGKSPISGRTVRNWKQRAYEDVEMFGVMAQARKSLGDFLEKYDDRDDVSVDDALEALDIMLELSLPSDLR